KKSMTAI
ncbi:Iron-sulfur cluster insertion protein ErpA, partial [Haemophilus influenzae]